LIEKRQQCGQIGSRLWPLIVVVYPAAAFDVATRFLIRTRIQL